MRQFEASEHTPPNGVLTATALHRLVDAAVASATTDHQRATVKTAREIVRRYERGVATYDFAATTVLSLQPMVERAREQSEPAAADVHLEASATAGVYFARSSRDPGTHWRTTATSCTCEAGHHGRDCRHQRAVRGLHSKPVSLVESDPFARVNRGGR